MVGVMSLTSVEAFDGFVDCIVFEFRASILSPEGFEVAPCGSVSPEISAFSESK